MRFKHYLIAAFAVTACGLLATASPFGFHRSAMQKAMKNRTERSARPQRAPGLNIGEAVNFLDKFSMVSTDTIYRYVYTYNLNGERASETIYIRENKDGKWTDEKFYDRGVYSYEYDTQKRVVVKNVKYESELDSYRVVADYGDEYITFTRYVDPAYDRDGVYKKDAVWQYYPTGQLASFELCERTFGIQAIHFDRNGAITECIDGDGYLKYTIDNNGLNDVRIKKYTPTKDPWELLTEQAYTYDPAKHRLIKYEDLGMRFEITRDNLGRISRFISYATDYNDNSVWYVDSDIRYTYWNDEVYGPTDSWRAVFGFEGPVKEILMVDDEGYHDLYKFNRDETGKLLSVDYTNDADGGSNDDIKVDNNGHIVYIQQTPLFDAPSSYAYTYTWQNGKCISENGGGEPVRTFSYSENQMTVSNWNTVSEINFTPYGIKMRKIEEDGYMEPDTTYVALETQQEDVSFLKPNLLKDINGFVPERTIVASRAGKVVGVRSDDRCEVNDLIYPFPWDEPVFTNTHEDDYFSISHDEGLTICSNLEDRPVYVLDGERLLKEYHYYGTPVSVGPAEPNDPQEAPATREVQVRPGLCYTVITYHYDESGKVTGQSVTEYDEEGTKTGEINLEYVYNEELSAVESVISTGKDIRLTGRMLDLADGTPFSVFDLAGHCLADNVSEYQFTDAGIYIIATTNGSMKIAVK